MGVLFEIVEGESVSIEVRDGEFWSSVDGEWYGIQVRGVWKGIWARGMYVVGKVKNDGEWKGGEDGRKTGEGGTIYGMMRFVFWWYWKIFDGGRFNLEDVVFDGTKDSELEERTGEVRRHFVYSRTWPKVE